MRLKVILIVFLSRIIHNQNSKKSKQTNKIRHFDKVRYRECVSKVCGKLKNNKKPLVDKFWRGLIRLIKSSPGCF